MILSEISGLDKAGILFQVLGDGLSITLFKDMSETDLRRVRSRAKELTGIPFKIKKSVLEEFYFGFLAAKFKDADDSGRKPFGFLEKLSDEQIAYLRDVIDKLNTLAYDHQHAPDMTACDGMAPTSIIGF